LDPKEDGHPNMPDLTEVQFVDSLGTVRLARRNRFEDSVDAADGVSPIGLDFLGLEQDFGMEFLEEPAEAPEMSLRFLGDFIDTTELDTEETRLIADLKQNGITIV